MNSRTAPSRGVMLLYLLPSFILYSFIVFLPIAFAVYYSMFDWAGGATMTFIGLENFRTAINDATFWLSFRNNIYLIVVCIIGQLGIAFLVASLINTKWILLKGLHRILGFFPYVLSAVVVGFIWRMIYDYNFGLLNALLRLVGLDHMTSIWLSEIRTIMAVASVPLIWQFIGMYLIIILAAMTSVDAEVLEMAEIDGANGFQRATKITFPLITPTLIVCIMLCVAGNMRVFDHIFAMTRGGPGFASHVMALYAYTVTFREGRMGYGTALSLLIMIMSFVLVVGTRVLLTQLSKNKEV